VNRKELLKLPIDERRKILADQVAELVSGDELAALKFLMDTFGYPSQRLMCSEECAELTQALCHESRGRKNNKIEELADVELSIQQMKSCLSPEDLDSFNTIKKMKLERAVRKAIDAQRK
jgi:hypothetical protein